MPETIMMLKFGNLFNENELAPVLFAKVGQELHGRGLEVNTGIIVAASILTAPSSTKNTDKAHDPEMHQTCKGQQSCFWLKLGIGVDCQSGQAYSAVVKAKSVLNKHPLPCLLHGKEQRVYGDAANASQKELIYSKVVDVKDGRGAPMKGGHFQEITRPSASTAVLTEFSPQRGFSALPIVETVFAVPSCPIRDCSICRCHSQ